MLKRFSTIVIIVALVYALAGNSALATTPPEKTAKPNDKLRTDTVKLLVDAKAGKVTPAARSQIQPAKSNNLSKGAKVALVLA